MNFWEVAYLKRFVLEQLKAVQVNGTNQKQLEQNFITDHNHYQQVSQRTGCKKKLLETESVKSKDEQRFSSLRENV